MFLLFRSFLRVHRNRRCIYMFVVWQTKSSKLFCWNMKPYGKIFLSEHVNDTIRVWFETIINRYPHTFQWRQKLNMFQNLIIGVRSFPFPRFLRVNDAQAVSMIISTTSCQTSPFMRMWTNSWRLPPTHQLLRTRSNLWFLFEAPKNLRNDLNLKSDCWISGYTFFIITWVNHIYLSIFYYVHTYTNIEICRFFSWW